MRTIFFTTARLAKATQLPPWLLAVIGCGLVTPCAAVAATDAQDVMLEDLRAALRMSGLSDKEVAYYLNINKGLCSKKLHGERPLAFVTLALLPVDVRRWLAVRWVMRHGVPVEVSTGARLERRALRMALTQSHKTGVA